MFVKSISSIVCDSWGRVIKRTTNFGEYRGYKIGIEENIYKGKTLSKTFLIWNDNMEKLIKKQRMESGKFKIVR